MRLTDEGEALDLSGLGEFDFDPKLDFRQHGIEAGIAGGGFQVGRGVAQPVHRGGVEIAGEQPELEVVEHVERALAARTDRLRRSVGSSTPCIAISASRLAAAFGAVAERISSGTAGVSGSEKPVELVRRVLLAGDPSVVPFGP